MNNFVVEKVRFGYRYLNSNKLSVFFKPNKVLTAQKILPAEGQSQLIPCGHD
jgi:hypothetical protein